MSAVPAPPRCATARPAAPRTWLLLGEKPGDNAQVRVVADALGWPCETRTLRMKPQWVLGKPPVRPSLAHVDLARSDALEPPWPDLLLTAGRRLSSAALWVKRASDDRTKLVLIGKPRRWMHRFDLVVAAAQYRMGAHPNVVRIGLPLMRVDPAAVAEAAGDAGRFEGLPRPLLALLVGGPTKALRFDARVARDVATRARRDAEAAGGSLFVCASRRTSPPLVDALAGALPASTPLYRWQAGDASNPYLPLLAAADRFAVTSDSVSMMVEIARLGRPLAIARLPARRARLRAVTRSRDLDAVARVLLAQGLASELGAPWRTPAGPLEDDVASVVARVRALVGEAPTAASAAGAAAT